MPKFLRLIFVRVVPPQFVQPRNSDLRIEQVFHIF